MLLYFSQIIILEDRQRQKEVDFHLLLFQLCLLEHTVVVGLVKGCQIANRLGDNIGGSRGIVDQSQLAEGRTCREVGDLNVLLHLAELKVTVKF